MKVSEANKLEYVNALARHRMTTSIRTQIAAFLEVRAGKHAYMMAWVAHDYAITFALNAGQDVFADFVHACPGSTDDEQSQSLHLKSVAGWPRPHSIRHSGPPRTPTLFGWAVVMFSSPRKLAIFAQSTYENADRMLSTVRASSTHALLATESCEHIIFWNPQSPFG